MVGLIWASAITIAAASAVISVLIVFLYARSFRFGINRLSIGHVLFASFISLQGVIATMSFMHLSAKLGPDVGVQALFISLAGLLALGSLLWATLQ